MIDPKDKLYTKNKRQNLDCPIFEFQNGIFQGNFLDHRRNGRGVFMWDNGQIFLGKWENDSIFGYGIVFFPFGGNLYGKFEKNKVHGLGIIKLPNGDMYASSSWKHGKLEGECLKFVFETNVWSLVSCKEGLVIKTLKSSQEDQANLLNQFSDIKQRITNDLSQQEHKDSPLVHLLTNTQSPSDNNLNYNMKKDIGFLVYNEQTWYFGIVEKGKANGLGILAFDNNVIARGVFKGSNLEGIGRQDMDNGIIYDGVFSNGKLALGFKFSFDENKFEYGHYKYNDDSKILQAGRGFPFSLMGLAKHKLYPMNYSYYYKYTAIEVVYLLTLEQDLMIKFTKKGVSFKNLRQKSLSPKIEKKTNSLSVNSANRLQRDQSENPQELFTTAKAPAKLPASSYQASRYKTPPNLRTKSIADDGGGRISEESAMNKVEVSSNIQMKKSPEKKDLVNEDKSLFNKQGKSQLNIDPVSQPLKYDLEHGDPRFGGLVSKGNKPNGFQENNGDKTLSKVQTVLVQSEYVIKESSRNSPPGNTVNKVRINQKETSNHVEFEEKANRSVSPEKNGAIYELMNDKKKAFEPSALSTRTNKTDVRNKEMEEKRIVAELTSSPNNQKGLGSDAGQGPVKYTGGGSYQEQFFKGESNNNKAKLVDSQRVIPSHSIQEKSASGINSSSLQRLKNSGTNIDDLLQNVEIFMKGSGEKPTTETRSKEEFKGDERIEKFQNPIVGESQVKSILHEHINEYRMSENATALNNHQPNPAQGLKNDEELNTSQKSNDAASDSGKSKRTRSSLLIKKQIIKESEHTNLLDQQYPRTSPTQGGLEVSDPFQRNFGIAKQINTELYVGGPKEIYMKPANTIEHALPFGNVIIPNREVYYQQPFEVGPGHVPYIRENKIFSSMYVVRSDREPPRQHSEVINLYNNKVERPVEISDRIDVRYTGNIYDPRLNFINE